MLRKIGLSNFKGWQELDIDLAPITLLFGVNSSGKTALLQALLLLKQTANSFDPKQHINFGGGRRDYVDFGGYQDLVYGHDTSRPIGLRLSWGLSTTAFYIPKRSIDDGEVSYNTRTYEAHSIDYAVSWRLDKDIFIETLGYVAGLADHAPHSVKVTHHKGDRYIVKLPQFSDVKTEKQLAGFENAPEEQVTVGTPGSCYILPDEFIKFGENDLFLFSAALFFNRRFESLMNRFLYLGPLRQYPKRYYQWTGERKSQVIEPDGADAMAALISAARDNESLQDDVAKWLKQLGLVDDFSIKSTDVRERFYEVIVKIGDSESALMDVGFGVSQVLPVIAMLLSAPPGSIVLLEQPELHLHPNAQSALADLMLHAAEKRGLQLIVESHSEHLLRRLQRRIAEVEQTFARPENIKMYFCAPSERGSTICQVKVDKYGQIANWPPNFMGDISGDIHEMSRAAFERRHQELAGV